MLRLASSISLLVAASLLAACAPEPARRSGPARLVVLCDDAQGEATMSDAAAARHFAIVNLKQTLGSSRDYLASQGIKRTRVARPAVSCTPYALGTGAWRCVASARLCAR